MGDLLRQAVVRLERQRLDREGVCVCVCVSVCVCACVGVVERVGVVALVCVR